MLPRLLLLLAGALCAAAQQRPPLPAPDHADIKYGPHERNVLDLWQAKTPGRHPLVIYYHGGGFRAGDKTDDQRRVTG
jgi:acetyl esterase/lipase